MQTGCINETSQNCHFSNDSVLFFFFLKMLYDQINKAVGQKNEDKEKAILRILTQAAAKTYLECLTGQADCANI